MLILFDIDDTLIDHSSAFDGATAALYASGGFDMPYEKFVANWSRAHRRNFDRYLLGELTYDEQRRARVRETIDVRLTDAESDRLFDIYLEVYESSWRLFDDVQECLEQLAGHRLGVISNGQSRQQRAKLERLGIAERFDEILISEECGWAKPDPRIFRRACSACGHSPAGSVYVGDSYELDASAARRAGLTGIWLDRRRSATAAHAAPIVATLAEVPQLARREA